MNTKPKLRENIRLQDFILREDKIRPIIKDPLLMGIKHPGYAVNKETIELLQLFDGKTSISEISHLMRHKYNELLTTKEINSVIEKADLFFLLQNDRYLEHHANIVSAIGNRIFIDGENVLFPSEKESLRNLIEDQVHNISEIEFAGKIKGVIIPHLNAITSGSLIVRALHKLVSCGFKKFLILGPNHLFHQTRAYLTERDFQTPLGNVRVMKDKVNKLMSKNSDLFEVNHLLHKHEHSLQVCFPYLQFLVGSELEVLPIAVSNRHFLDQKQKNPETMRQLAIDIKEVIEDDMALIVSGDLSHYLGDPYKKLSSRVRNNLSEEIKKIDMRILNHISEGDMDGFYAYSGKVNFCIFDSLYVGWNSARLNRGYMIDYYQTKTLVAGNIGTSVATFLLV